MKNKIIFITHASHKSFFEDRDKKRIWRISHDWYSLEANIMKRYHPDLEIECWTLEKEPDKKEEIIINSIKYKIFPTTFSIRHSMEISLQMLKEFIKEQAMNKDKKLIFHFHEYHAWQIYLMLLFKKNNSKIFAQHHGARNPFKNLTRYWISYMGLPVFLFFQILENYLLKRVNVFYALSDEELEYLGEKAPSSLIKYQTMGIEEDCFKKINQKNARRELKLDLDKKYIIYIGRVIKNKGMGELLEAFKNIEDRYHLLIIGEETKDKRYRLYARKNKLSNISFLGPIYENKKLKYLAAADCLILPSYTEGAPVVIMEALAQNLPVIATDVGGIKRMIINKKNGVIIKPKSSKDIEKAIIEVMSWKKENIRVFAEKYKWKNIIRSTYNDYIRC
jgi:glycosyltransferase involved in cell wall biosynthesis